MITPKLEQLILCGRAFFKTAVIGGSKTTIDIDNDRFIIITDITYLPYANAGTNPALIDQDINTQLSIYGEKGFNHYFFANNRPMTQIDHGGGGGPGTPIYARQMMPPQKIDCYIYHTTQVGFSFLTDAALIPVTSTAVADYNNPAYELPLDYGKDGMPGAIAIDNTVEYLPSLNNRLVKRAGGLGVGTPITEQVQLPAGAVTKPSVNNNKFFPVANINYVEIIGLPENIGF